LTCLDFRIWHFSFYFICISLFTHIPALLCVFIIFPPITYPYKTALLKDDGLYSFIHISSPGPRTSHLHHSSKQLILLP
jgi:hypothetical protein